ncbi:MAG: alpha-amylase family glycosyl hydrolase [Desulfatiglandales bacterium]
MKGQNPAATGAMDGGGSVAERTCRSLLGAAHSILDKSDPKFGFRQVHQVVSYLAELGISHLYASPVFRARRGSLHVYDVVDPGRLNPEMGPEKDFEALIHHLKDRNMGYIQDIVPNHMAFDYENEMLMDVLENGQASRYHGYFDIEWRHSFDSMQGRVLAPFLEKFFGEALESSACSTMMHRVSGFAISTWHFPETGVLQPSAHAGTG